MRQVLLGVAIVGLLLGGAALAAPSPVSVDDDRGSSGVSAAPARSAMPLFAYYYLWFDTPSWDRAKIDQPLLGRYSSDDVEVMRTHVRQAKAAGIAGFIVSWKSTELNDRRLHQLVAVARAETFAIEVIYQGLDFDRDPQPVERIAADLRYFRDTFAPDPVFHALSRPVVIWSGTWKFTREQVAAAVAPVRADLQVLASEKDVAGYTRLADVVEGNAYYWSSVDPARYPGFGAKLQQMGDAVHSRGGLWLAPFAPGFDARLVGGTRAVDRHDGDTLRAEFNAAVSSSPDVLGLISWNEFSENTHVEPSATFGTRYLDVLSEITASPAGAAGELAQDSSNGAGPGTGLLPRFVVAIGATVALLAAGIAVVTLRRRAVARRRPTRRAPTTGRHARHSAIPGGF